MTAMEYFSRIALHSFSVSVVLPEPTGSPIPTRSGPFSCAEYPRWLGFVVHRRYVRGPGDGAEIIKGGGGGCTIYIFLSINIVTTATASLLPCLGSVNI